METESTNYINNCTEEISAELSFIAASPIMGKIRACAEVLAKIDIPVLIVGESGSGKEITARLIHKLSARSGHLFLKVNCAALPADFLQGELFGYEAGAFTDDEPVKAGVFELCDKGTILLDQITEMPAPLQAELLRVLENKRFSRVGGEHSVNMDVRILATSDMKLDHALAERKLNEGIYYHLSACTVQVPPLRHRREEIPLLLDHVMHQVAKQWALSPRNFSAAVVESCQSYPWPGNFRELEKFVKRYLIAGNEGPAISFDRDEGNPRQTLSDGQAHWYLESSPNVSGKSLLQSVRGEAERNAIAKVLEETSWNRKAAARLLRISYRTLLYKIEQYHMNDPSIPHPSHSLLSGSVKKHA